LSIKTPITSDEEITPEISDLLGLTKDADIDIEIVDEDTIGEIEVIDEGQEEDTPDVQIQERAAEPETVVAPAEPEAKDTKPNQSRAQERIRELNTKKKDAEARAEAERVEKETALAETRRLQIELAKLKLTQFDGAIKEARREYIEAEEASDPVAKLEAHERISQLTTGKMALEQAVKTVETTAEVAAVKPAQTQRQADPVDLPEAVTSWMDKNTWFKTSQDEIKKLPRKDRIKMQIALEASMKLNESGEFAEDSHEFYEALDKEINDELAALGMTTVQSVTDEPSKTAEDVKKQAMSTQTETPTTAASDPRQTKQNVSSPVSSGSAGLSTGAPTSKTRVVLTAREKDLADQMGVSHADWARQKILDQQRQGQK